MQGESKKGIKLPLPHIVYDEECANIFHSCLVAKVLKLHHPDHLVIVVRIHAVALKQDIHMGVQSSTIIIHLVHVHDVQSLS